MTRLYFLQQYSAGAVALLTGIVIASASSQIRAADKAAGWTEDVNAAVERAASEDKDLLLFFTGSDWCPPCKMLNEEVFDQEGFFGRIEKDYVTALLDFPREGDQPDQVRQRNQEWAQRFGIDGFPTVVLTDVALKPYAFLGYEAGGLENYLALIDQNHQLRVVRDQKLDQASSAEGAEKAKLLDEAIGGLREDLVRVYYPEIVEQIVQLDANDELGLRSQWNSQADAELRKMMLTDMLIASRIEAPADAVQFIDKVVSEIPFSGNELFDAMQIKLSLLRQLDDHEAVDELMKQMIDLDGLSESSRQRLIVKRLYLMGGDGRKNEAYQALDDYLLSSPNSPWLLLARGTLLDADQQHDKALECLDLAAQGARSNPDLLIDITSASADTLMASGNPTAALQTLDNFAEDTSMPAELRAEALLHKSLIMRDMGRVRQAMLAENRAVEISDSARERSETQKIVDQIRENSIELQ